MRPRALHRQHGSILAAVQYRPQRLGVRFQLARVRADRDRRGAGRDLPLLSLRFRAPLSPRPVLSGRPGAAELGDAPGRALHDDHERRSLGRRATTAAFSSNTTPGSPPRSTATGERGSSAGIDSGRPWRASSAMPTRVQPDPRVSRRRCAYPGSSCSRSSGRSPRCASATPAPSAEDLGMRFTPPANQAA
jgi:hypothetical protein